MPRRRRLQLNASFVARIVVGLACAFAALAFGGVHLEVVSITAVIACIALVIAGWRSTGLALDGFGAVLLLLLVLTALQLVPLPFGLVELLSPRTAATHASAAAATGSATPGTIALSLDPQATRLMLAWAIAVFATYITARKLSHITKRRRLVVQAVPLIGLAVMAVGLVHAVLGLEAIYGSYEPTAGALTSVTGASYQSSFINPNHLAAFLTLSMATALGFTMADDLSQQQRVGWVAVFLALGVGVVLTGSRAGTIIAALAVLMVIAGRRIRPARAAIMAIVVAAGLVVLYTPLGAEVRSITDLDYADSGQATTHGVGMDVIKAWPAVGVGRGAFGVAYTQVAGDRMRYTVTHIHNTPLQLIADFGVLAGGLLLLGGVILLGRSLFRALGDPLLRGLAIGLAAVAAHNLFDFSLDILGVAMAAAIMAGALRHDARELKLPWKPVVGLAVIGIVVSTTIGLTTVAEPGPRRDALIEAKAPELLHTFPADPYTWLQAGAREKSMALLDHADLLHPTEPHIPLAKALLTEDATAALQLARRALEHSRTPRMQKKVFRVIRARAKTGRDIVDALPDRGDVAANLLQFLPQRPEAILRPLIRRFADDTTLLREAAKIRYGQRRWDDLDDIATRLIVLDDKIGYRYMGDVLSRRGRHYEAQHMYLEAGDPDSQLEAAGQALADNKPERALEILGKARVSAKQMKGVNRLRDRAQKMLDQSASKASL